MGRRTIRNAEAEWARARLGPESPGESISEIRPGWSTAWRELELPALAGAPPGFSARVVRELSAERGRAEAPLLAAAWMRAAAAVALLAGAVLGSTLSMGDEEGVAGDDTWTQASLSEEYLSAMATPDAVLAGAPVEAPPDEAP